MLTRTLPPRLLLGLLTVGAVAASPAPARAQTVNTTQFTVVGAGVGRVQGQLFRTAGGWLVGGQVAFRSDSNSASVLRLDPALNITRSRQYTLGGYANTGPFVQTGSGLVFRRSSSSAECLFSLDSTFAVRWAQQIRPNVGFSILLTHGPDRIVGYPTTSVVAGNNTFTRVWGNVSTGAGWRGRRLTSTVGSWRITSGFAPDNTGIHYLTGDSGAPLIKLDTTKVYWSFLLDAGGLETSIGRPLAAANGNLWVPMYNIPATGQPSVAVICRYDTAGTLLWSRQLALANRYLAFSDLHELPGGDLLISGYLRVGPGGKFQPTLYRFTSAGTLVWGHHWNLGTSGPLGGTPTIVSLPGGQFRLFNSDLSFIDLDANFNGCQFVDITASLTVTTPTITATPLPLTMTTIAITTAPQVFRNRSFAYTRALLCSAVGLDEEEASAEVPALGAWPQPLLRGETLRLALPANWPTTSTHLTLTSALGQVVWRGPWAPAITLPAALPAGVWTLTATGPRGQHLTRRLMLADR